MTSPFDEPGTSAQVPPAKVPSREGGTPPPAPRKKPPTPSVNGPVTIRQPDVPGAFEGVRQRSAEVAAASHASGEPVPERWLTDQTPDDIDALRSSSSSGHRRRPRRRSMTVPLIVLIVIAAAAAVWQLGFLDPLFDPAPDVQTALEEAGFSSVTATVDGDTAVLTGWTDSQTALGDLVSVALGVEGVSQVVNEVVVLTGEPVATLDAQIVSTLAAAGFFNLNIVVNGDMVTVSGTVPDEETRGNVANTILSVPGVAQVDNRLQVGPPPTSPDVQAAADAALAGDEFNDVSVVVQETIAVLTGTVASEDARSEAAAVVLAVPGIDKLDNRLNVDESIPVGPTLPPEQLTAAATTALTGAGIETVTVTIEGRSAILDGVVPLEVLGDGFFSYVDAAEEAVLTVDGIDVVTSRLTLRGNDAVLRSELRSLIEATPIVFAFGSPDLTAESQAVLDRAAQIIQSQPGLTVLIAGHTDTAGSSETNESLSRQRAGAVLSYLLSRGVPPYRLAIVSYGELFPDLEATDAQNRRIEFEVGP